MLTWLMVSVQNTFPRGSHVVFHFDACADDSLAIFRTSRQCLLDDRGFIVHEIVTEPPEIGPLRAEDKILHRFMETDCDFAHLLQDDQHLKSKLPEHVEELWKKSTIPVGLIGGRDGYEWNYQHFIHSPWSLSTVPWPEEKKIKLKPGQYLPCSFVNPNPLVFSRSLIEEIGYYDLQFESFYHWDDYCRRASLAGLQNYIIGTDLEHVKFGRVSTSHLGADGAMATRDLNRLHDKHPYIEDRIKLGEVGITGMYS